MNPILWKIWKRIVGVDFPKNLGNYLPGGGRSCVVDGVEYRTAQPSRYVPGIPQYPVNLFKPDDPTEGQVLLNAITVGKCILDVLAEWRCAGYFPQSANDYVQESYGRYASLRTRVPRHVWSNVPAEEIEDLARQYVVELRRDSRFLREFKKGRIALPDVAIDFANTIACGETLQAVLDSHG